MHILRFLLISIATLAALAGASTPAAAGESYDNCVGFIDALPATITTQGTWCLRQDLDSAATGGNMIEIQRSNVTIDCNGFRMRGLGGGGSTSAVGIYANSQSNLRIRHCTLRGFSKGIELFGGGDFIVENNRST
jgi:nitrous oxidase accessory protein NosD